MGSAPRKQVLPVERSLSTDSSSSSSSTPPSSFNNSAVPLIIITAPSRENLLETPVRLKIADANKEPRPLGGPVVVGRGRFVTGTA
ncbi:hypothetical protein G5714_024498 [Onychostoma macrolepis]|uniref:Uncharacterized protein n=1 Tax=Onychostoma macrolepis TaxID=369639 RepID=A0A7J6BJX9_9TELE|nr:hypothetical protein G5714_024498 [Onychostoma macrolepis]